MGDVVVETEIFRNTRIAKLDAADSPYAALVLARAGLVRLGWGDRITCDLTPPVLYHAVSQGALAIEVRVDDEEAIELCRRINHRETGLRCTAERACLRVLEGGCSVPVGVASEVVQGGVLRLTGCVTSVDGRDHVEYTLEEKVDSVDDAERTGAKLAKILIEKGAKRILDEINADRERRAAE
jgi:hydroxymethylbilane synthase